MLFQDIEQSFEDNQSLAPSEDVVPAITQDAFSDTNNQVIDYAALYDLFEDHDVVMTLLNGFAVSFMEDNKRTNDLVTEDTDLDQVESEIEASIAEVTTTFERFTEEINHLRQTKEKAYSYE
jgi:two-component system, NarL family, sensor histidine kinase EvgS